MSNFSTSFSYRPGGHQAQLSRGRSHLLPQPSLERGAQRPQQRVDQGPGEGGKKLYITHMILVRDNTTQW